MKNINLPRNLKKIIIISADVICILFSVFIAFSLRLEMFYSPLNINITVYLLFLIIIIGVNFFFGIYDTVIRFFNILNILNLSKSLIICALFIIFANLIIYKQIYFPRSVPYIAIVLIFLSMIFIRVILNLILNFNYSKKKNCLLIGVSRNSLNVMNLSRNPESLINISSIIDATKDLKKTKINGISISKFEDLEKILKNNEFDFIILNEKFNNIKIKNIILKDFKIDNVRIINLDQSIQLVQGQKHSPEKNLNFHDIVDKTKFHPNKDLLLKKIRNKSILITGAGGSIGSELAKQISIYKPRYLYLLDNSEINLFDIYNNLITNKKNFVNKVKIILCDCNKINDLKLNDLKSKKIDIIFHAAAFKHLSFGENNLDSMIYNNVNGLKQMLNFCNYMKVKEFIFISSDKAVNPKSILGISKKIGEYLVFYYYKMINNRTNYSIVRFGNVIGSSGSVIPKFINQISSSSQLTLSHKKVKRYFMSIQEAIYLTLYSMTLKKNFNIFALDMGNQIPIYNIANRIIKLSGMNAKTKKNAKGDIEIKISGLKRGEKIKEEISLGKNLERTTHDKIFRCNENFEIKIVSKKIKNILRKISLNKSINKKKIINDFK